MRFVWVLCVVAACGKKPRADVEPPLPPLPSATTPPSASQAIAADASAPPSVCGDNMALVEGGLCITPEERCLEHQKIPSGDRGMVEDQCIVYAQPVKCFGERRKHLRYCMDVYEWPNRKGELPRTLTSWQDAKKTCEGIGKRLCTEDEFNFACEGEAMKPYVYGYARDKTMCNFDRPYRPRTFNFLAWDACQADGACKAAFDAIDQRLPAGSLETCKNAQGIYDLNGNVNEWVNIPGARAPHRSGLKGGWWGPVRDRCRPMVTFHDEGDFGYEVGFRCCKDAP